MTCESFTAIAHSPWHFSEVGPTFIGKLWFVQISVLLRYTLCSTLKLVLRENKLKSLLTGSHSTPNSPPPLSVAQFSDTEFIARQAPGHA